MHTRVLVIEDNADNLELMTYLLKQFQYTTLIATDGEEGLKIAQNELPDLIICDIRLPKLTGVDIVKQLKSDDQCKKIPIIAVTAYSMVGDRDKFLAMGFDGYIAKPIDPEIFIKQIEEFLKVEQRSKHRAYTNGTSSNIVKNIDSSNAKGTILVVDDSAENRELSCTLLAAAGFNTILASDVKKALKILEQTTPDLILSDMHIPDMTGLDFLRIVKQNPALKQIPFIILSSSRPTQYQQKECIALGAVKLIFRPIDPHLFLQMIDEVWSS